MPSVFLSYDRSDLGRAKPVALALEKAGHSVWWDRHITGGAQFGTEIEEALRRSDAVLVLWSAAAIGSAWVRDEAGVGRDAGKLVPARLDTVDPPMGFRQYQTIDLMRWKGNRNAEPFRELVRAINSLGPKQSREPPPAIAPTPVARRWWLRYGLATAVVVTALIVGAWLVVGGVRSKEPPVVAVTPADTSATSGQLARDLYVKLGRLQAIDTHPIELIDRGASRSPDFNFQIAASTIGPQANASVTLTGRNRALLWSREFERPADQLADLKQQVGLSAARVLECATKATYSGGLDEQTLKLYLNGCATLSELAWTDFRALVPVFRQVTIKAPDFESGWAHLLLTEAYMVGWELLGMDSPEAATLRKDVAEARKRYPQIAEAFWAEYVLSDDSLARKADNLERAIKIHPDHPVLLSAHAGFLVSVGRMTEAMEKSKRAAELSPLSPDETSGYINVLGWAGRSDLAQLELDKAERLWPGSRSLIDASWRHHLRFGDPEEALRITRSGVNAGYADYESYLLARVDPTPQKVGRAIADAKAKIGRTPRSVGALVQTLAEFGREDEIFQILETSRDKGMIDSIDAFFRPAFRRFRQNPRFIRVAERFGLIAYWVESGKWPDFCFEPGLPYDCKAEAAKLHN